MTKTFTTLLVAASLALGAGTAFAQDVAPPPDRGAECHGRHGRGEHFFGPEAMERRITHLTERLALDAHQVTLVREIFASTRTEAEALRTSTTSGPARREAFHALMQSTHARIDAVLTDAQRAQFAALVAERRAHAGGRRGHRHGAPPPSAAPDRGI